MILGSQPVTRQRFAAGAVSAAGRWTEGATTSTTILASVQPATGRQLQRLPEGLRERVELMAFTETELRTADQATGLSADRIVVDGETYQVAHVRHWPTFGPLPHYEAALERFDETGGEV